MDTEGLKLISICVVPPLYPVVNNVPHRKCYFDTAALYIFPITEGEPTPIALPSSNRVVHVALSGGKDPTISYRIEASCGGRRLITPQDVTPAQFKGFDVQLDPLAIPWSFIGDVTWSCTPLAGKVRQTSILGVSPVEIYVVSFALPKYLDAYGIPLSLLRYNSIFPAWMRLNQPRPTWQAFVTAALFNDPHLQYDVFSGGSRYSVWDEATPTGQWLGAGKEVWIELFLSDLNGAINGTNRAQKFPVNCYDLSMIAHVIISLGVAVPNNLKLMYLSPFGYIKPTKLIGVTSANQTCNNPFFGLTNGPVIYDSNMLCDPQSENRSRFDCHMFLAYPPTSVETPKVFDACTLKLGTTDVATYLDEVIDSTAGLRYQDTERYPLKGTLAQVKPVTVPEKLVMSTSFEAVPSENHGIFKKMADVFGTDKLMSGYDTATKSIVLRLSSVSATWTYVPAEGKLVMISISRFGSVDDLTSTYKARRKALRGCTDLPKEGNCENLFCQLLDGSKLWMSQRMTSPGMGYGKESFLLTIEAPATSAPIGFDVWKTIQAKILPLTEDFTVDLRLSATVPVSPVTRSAQVGEKFHIYFYPEKDLEEDITAAAWFKACKAFSANGNVLLLSANATHNGPKGTPQRPLQCIELVFLARTSGADTISVIMYGPNLDWAEKTFPITVT